MTVVAYKDGVIASDSQLVSRMLTCLGEFEKVGRREVFRTEGYAIPASSDVYLFGSTGETAYCAKFSEWVKSDAFVSWLDTGLGAPSLEPQGKDELCTGFIFHPDGKTCTRFEGNYPPFQITGDFFAFGSGDMCALSAMAAGATAVEAVEIACRFDALSNGPVQSITR